MKRITAAIGAVAAAAIIGGTAVFAAGPGHDAAEYGSVENGGNSGDTENSTVLDGQSTRVCDHYQDRTEESTFNGSTSDSFQAGAHHQESGQGRHLSGH